MTDIVAVEQHRMAPGGNQLLFYEIGNRRLAGSRQSGKPQHGRRLTFQSRPLFSSDCQRLPMDVAGPAQTEADHPGTGGLVGQPVNQYEGSGISVLSIRVKSDRGGGREIAEPNIV